MNKTRQYEAATAWTGACTQTERWHRSGSGEGGDSGKGSDEDGGSDDDDSSGGGSKCKGTSGK